MYAMSRLRLPIAFIVGGTFAALLALAAFSQTASANHAWGSYHWATTKYPFTLQLGDNVSSAWDGYLNTTSLATQNKGWDYSTKLDTNIVAGGTTGRQCRPTSGRVEVCNANYGSTGWLGIAQIWASGSRIVQGTTKLNDTYFNTAKYNTPAWRNLVMCQEVGHTFGLAHQDENFSNTNLGSCMDYTNNPSGGGTNGALSNEYPNSHDYAQLGTIYNATDTTNTVGNTSAASRFPGEANRGDLNSRRDWGRLIRTSPDTRLQKYERDFGNNIKMFTFVIWAENAPQANGNGREDEHTEDEHTEGESAPAESAE
jgi:hypothetical protein